MSLLNYNDDDGTFRKAHPYINQVHDMPKVLAEAILWWFHNATTF
jgi:hypothetical protein